MIVQPTEDNMEFDSNHSDNKDNRHSPLIIIDGVKLTLIGGVWTGTIFFIENEVPSREFIILTLLSIFVMHIIYVLYDQDLANSARDPDGDDK